MLLFRQFQPSVANTDRHSGSAHSERDGYHRKQWGDTIAGWTRESGALDVNEHPEQRAICENRFKNPLNRMRTLVGLYIFAHLHHLGLVSDIVELLVHAGDELFGPVGRDRPLV
jgi:hypothetical protein